MNSIKAFCKYLLHEYLEKCNYRIFETYMHPKASVIGTGGFEFFPSAEEFWGNQIFVGFPKVLWGLSMGAVADFSKLSWGSSVGARNGGSLWGLSSR